MNMQSADRDGIEPGKYIGRATAAVRSRSSNGNERVVVSFVITQGKYDGKICTWLGYLTEKTADRTLESLRTCGWTGNDIDNLDGIEANEVELDVRHNQNPETGKTHVEVRWVNALGGFRNRMSSNDAFAARIRDRLAVLDKKRSGQQADDDDNVPF
jgi:hypothetical protein